MAHDSRFDSAWLKWAQAVKHAHALEDDIDAFSEHHEPLLRSRTEYQAKRHGFAVIVEEVGPTPIRWQLVLGDVANNYRAALDHLAWALVSRGRTPPGSGKLTSGQENAVYFPISEDRHQFNAQIRRPANLKTRLNLPGIRRADAAKVRRRQPYHHSARRRSMHALVLLAGVNSGDKHRTVQPIWAQPTRVDLEVTDARDCEVPRLGFRRNRNPLEVGVELAYIGVRRTGANPQLEVKVAVTAEPSIGNRISFKEWGTRAGAFISGLLIEFSDPSQELVEATGVDLRRFMASTQALGL